MDLVVSYDKKILLVSICYYKCFICHYFCGYIVVQVLTISFLFEPLDEECITLDGFSLIDDQDEIVEPETASMAVLDLVRGATVGLPGGIAMANHAKKTLNMNIDVLKLQHMQHNEFGLPAGYDYDDVPLLVYLGHEAWAHNRGRYMGQLGSYIIAETIYANARDTPEGTIVGSDWKSTITGTSRVSWLEITKFVEW